MMAKVWAFIQRHRWKFIALAGAPLVLLCVALIAITLLRPSFPTPAHLTAEARADLALTGGARVFEVHCAYCHSATIGPKLGGPDLPPEAIALFVRNGVGAMPAFTPVQVSDADLSAVAMYIASLPAPAETEAQP